MAGGIQQNIPRKNGVMPTNALGRSPFTKNTPGHNVILGYEGEEYPDDVTLRQMSDSIPSDIPPLANQFNNATLPQVAALQVTTPGTVVTVSQFTKIHPFETAVLFTSGRVKKVVHRAGGPSPHTDTPFHPTAPAPAPVQRSRPSPQSLRKFNVAKTGSTTTGSFLNTGSSGGAGTLVAHSHGDTTTPRWSTVKKGAAG
jgi:hypothetical protein